MTIDERQQYIPPGAAEEIAKAIDDAWRAAEREIWDAVADPTDALAAMGDFAEDLALEQWAEIRRIAPAASMAWNTARRILDTPCDDPYTILIETALPALGDAIVLLLTPSPKQILENYLRPKGLLRASRRSRLARLARRRRTKNGKLRRTWPLFPDVDEMIAERLPGRAIVGYRVATAPTRWLFTGIALADILGLGMLLADLGTDFFYHWSANMSARPFCTVEHTVLYVGELAKTTGSIGIQGGAVGQVPPWRTLHHKGAQEGPILAFTVPTSGTVHVSTNATYESAGGGQIVSARLEANSAEGDNILLGEDTRTLTPGENHITWSFSAPFDGAVALLFVVSRPLLTAIGPGVALATGTPSG